MIWACLRLTAWCGMTIWHVSWSRPITNRSRSASSGMVSPEGAPAGDLNRMSDGIRRVRDENGRRVPPSGPITYPGMLPVGPVERKEGHAVEWRCGVQWDGAASCLPPTPRAEVSDRAEEIKLEEESDGDG